MPLKTKQVGAYTVSQFGTLESVRARLFNEQIEPLKRTGELSEDDKAYNAWLDEWTGVASCVTPFISREAYREMDLELYMQIITAFTELTGDMTEVAVTRSKKKKSNAPKKSTNELEK